VIALAKDAVDVGLFTELLDESLSFWGDDVGLTYEEMLPIGGGVRQHRFTIGDSVVKVNHSAHPLPHDEATTLAAIRVARPGATSRKSLATPDGVVVETGPDDRSAAPALTVVVRTPQPAEVTSFWSQLGLQRHVIVEEESSGHYTGEMRAAGFRFVTVQVRDVHAAHAELMSASWRELSPPTRFGDVAVVCFVADPDGVPIEISQRASLVGSLPDS
jgi:catechol 2,3-dioxygenase-like lactoylglutathione lyase family enzyme